MLSGCQVTPKEDIAVNKNDVGLESKILQSESTVDNDSLKRNSHWEDKWITDVDDISIAVDADVETLGEKYSVVRVLPHDITSDEVKEWADVLFEGNKAYEPETVMTKNEIEESILKFKQKLNNKEDRDKAFRDVFLEEFSELFDDVDEVRTYLQNHISDSPYHWLGNKAVTAKIKTMANAKYNESGYGKAKKVIDEMPAEQVKEYLKKMIEDNFVVGLEIIKKQK